MNFTQKHEFSGGTIDVGVGYEGPFEGDKKFEHALDNSIADITAIVIPMSVSYINTLSGLIEDGLFEFTPDERIAKSIATGATFTHGLHTADLTIMVELTSTELPATIVEHILAKSGVAEFGKLLPAAIVARDTEDSLRKISGSLFSHGHIIGLGFGVGSG